MLPANLQVRAHKPPDHAGGEYMMMVLVREKYVHTGRQYTNANQIWQEAKSTLPDGFHLSMTCMIDKRHTAIVTFVTLNFHQTIHTIVVIVY